MVVSSTSKVLAAILAQLVSLFSFDIRIWMLSLSIPAQTTSESGPNGNIDWMNCGIHAGGWNPPNLNLGNVRYKSLGEALAMPNSPYQACREYIHLFERYGAETGIPPIMIAAFALQESSCRPYITGGGGEQGLMQITRDKCGGAPGGDCKNPVSRIKQASLVSLFVDIGRICTGFQHSHWC
jgi:hypothetical protein